MKNLCCGLDEVETQAITEAVKRLRHSVNLPRTHSPKVGTPHTHTHGIVWIKDVPLTPTCSDCVDGVHICWSITKW